MASSLLIWLSQGDVLEPKDGVMAVGSGGAFALGRFLIEDSDLINLIILAAARALVDTDMDAEAIARKVSSRCHNIDVTSFTSLEHSRQ